MEKTIKSLNNRSNRASSSQLKSLSSWWNNNWKNKTGRESTLLMASPETTITSPSGMRKSDSKLNWLTSSLWTANKPLPWKGSRKEEKPPAETMITRRQSRKKWRLSTLKPFQSFKISKNKADSSYKSTLRNHPTKFSMRLRLTSKSSVSNKNDYFSFCIFY